MQPRAAVRAKPFYLAGLGRTAVRAHGLNALEIAALPALYGNNLGALGAAAAQQAENTSGATTAK